MSRVVGDGLPVIMAAGEFDLATVHLLEDALARAIASRQEDVILDLSAVDFFGAEAAHTTLCSHARLDDQAGALASSAYTLVAAEKQPRGGIRQAAPPARWLAYFGVASVTETLRNCASAGGSMLLALHEPRGAAFALLQDPEGATFGVCEPGFVPDQARARAAHEGEPPERRDVTSDPSSL